MPYLFKRTISNHQIVKEIELVQLEEEEDERGVRRRSHHLQRM
jgi:hypothetical protein